jgi:hypothetical protein
MANSYDFDASHRKGADMKGTSACLLGLTLLAVSAAAAPRGGIVRQQEEVPPPPTPLEDPYVPPAGDPDIFAPEGGPGEVPSPLNPQGD